jgi:hypothetical protein
MATLHHVQETIRPGGVLLTLQRKEDRLVSITVARQG